MRLILDRTRTIARSPLELQRDTFIAASRRPRHYHEVRV